MVFIKSIELVSLTLLVVGACTQARSVSYNTIGDVKIIVTDDKWQCDRIQCPDNAYRCFVSKSNEADPSILKRINICYSKDNEVLVNDVFTSSADVNSKIRQQISSTRNGIVPSSSNGYYGSHINNNFDETEFKKELNHGLNNMHHNLQSEMSNLNRESHIQRKDLEASLGEMHEHIHENIQSQMKALHENMNKMQNDLQNMFG